MKRSRSGLVWHVLFLATLTSACTTEYGRSRGPLARPVLLKLPVTCNPVQAGASSLTVAVTFDGQPLPGALLKLTPLIGHGKASHGVAGANGRYETVLPPGVWELECRLQSFAPLRTHISIPELGACSVSVQLELSPQITVT
jgi:hypothetical protein